MVLKSKRMNRYNAAVVAEKEYRRLNSIEIEGNQVYCQAERPLLFHPSIRLGSERVVVENQNQLNLIFAGRAKNTLTLEKRMAEVLYY